MKDMALHLRQESKRMDIPIDVIRTLSEAYAEMILLQEERDEANSLVRRIFSEINCRIENGAESNGHLEGLYGLYYKEARNG